MKVVCSYCRADLGEREPLACSTVSHGMCPACSEHFLKQWQGLHLGEYLDRFDVPVAVVDADGRIVGANQKLADLLGRSNRETFGLLGGEALECAHARLPGGCGQTVHCKACTVRNAVTKTLMEDVDLDDVRAYVDQRDGRTRLVISTRRLREYVELRITEVRP